MPAKKPSQAKKPLVFLSHASANHRELRALKEFLNRRAAGMVEFFLSSDHESIPPGTLWSAEVKAALDRMDLILIFASKEALESRWTYFEAGYGLHVTGKAAIYCLHGCSRDSLPSPFSILQNRNLHSAKDLSLLIRHCNEALGASMDEKVSSVDYGSIFPAPLKPKSKQPLPIREAVFKIEINALSSEHGASDFNTAAEELGHKPHLLAKRSTNDSAELGAPGVAFRTQKPESENWLDIGGLDEQITAASKQGIQQVLCPSELQWIINDTGDAGSLLEALKEDQAIHFRRTPKKDLIDFWHAGRLNDFARIPSGFSAIPLTEARILLHKLAQINDFIQEANARRLRSERKCGFTIEPAALSIASDIFDNWHARQAEQKHYAITIQFYFGYRCVKEPETLSALLLGSKLSFEGVSGIKWLEKYRLNVIGPPGGTSLKIRSSTQDLLADFDIQGLIAALWQTEVLYKSKT